VSAVIFGAVESTVVEVNAMLLGPFWTLPVKVIVPVTVPVTNKRAEDAAGNTASVALAGIVKLTLLPPVENWPAEYAPAGIPAAGVTLSVMVPWIAAAYGEDNFNERGICCAGSTLICKPFNDIVGAEPEPGGVSTARLVGSWAVFAGLSLSVTRIVK